MRATSARAPSAQPCPAVGHAFTPAKDEEVDMTLCAECQAWRDSLTLDMPCFFLGRVCRENVGACLGCTMRISWHMCRAFRRPLALWFVALCPQPDMCPHLSLAYLALSLRYLPSHFNILWGLDHCSVLLRHLHLPPPAESAAAGCEASAAKGRVAGPAQLRGLPRRRRALPGLEAGSGLGQHLSPDGQTHRKTRSKSRP